MNSEPHSKIKKIYREMIGLRLEVGKVSIEVKN